jgi:predicted alpha/beta-hydrolase family hydrolase
MNRVEEHATQFRERAVKLRLIAEAMHDLKSEKMCLTLAEEYHRMAETSEAIASIRSQIRRRNA